MNRQWVGDGTVLKANGRLCFLASVMEVYSRLIVGWALGRDRTVHLTGQALARAVGQRQPTAQLSFHSDRGIEYGADRTRDALRYHGLRSRLNRPGSCRDNAHRESFFHTMKAEWIRGRRFATFSELEQALKAYIRFTNRHRLHSSIDHHTPEEVERWMA